MLCVCVSVSCSCVIWKCVCIVVELLFVLCFVRVSVCVECV